MSRPDVYTKDCGFCRLRFGVVGEVVGR